MNRLEKIKELFVNIEKDMALISLLMGNKSEWIDESYVEEKEMLGVRLIPYLDRENKNRFLNIYTPLLNEYQVFKETYKNGC